MSKTTARPWKRWVDPVDGSVNIVGGAKGMEYVATVGYVALNEEADTGDRETILADADLIVAAVNAYDGED